MAEPKKRVCKDCVAEGGSDRPAPYEGPRCYTHHHARKKQLRQAARSKRWESVYSITAEQYQALYEFQGGKCAICGVGRGLSKALFVDHDHACCDGPTSCGECVRGLLDEPCNTYLGRIKDSPEIAQRLLNYLSDPPARRVFDNWDDYEPPED